jgi:hypothetical protein
MFPAKSNYFWNARVEDSCKKSLRSRAPAALVAFLLLMGGSRIRRGEEERTESRFEEEADWERVNGHIPYTD